MTTQKSSATSRPWKVAENDPRHNKVEIITCEDELPVMVAEINTVPRHVWRKPENPFSDANLIVRAVNSFDATRTALREIIELLNDDVDNALDAVILARKALNTTDESLPACCNATIDSHATVKLSDGESQPVECSQCHRAVIFNIVEGWTRYWKPCDVCHKPTSHERRNESEPPEGAFCPNCGNWICPNCQYQDDADKNRTICGPCSEGVIVSFRCDECDEEAIIAGEINEKTLEDEGWYLGPALTLCPQHSEQENA